MTRSDWTEIERAYVAGEGSLTVLADRFHVFRRQFATEVKEGGWTAKRDAREA